MTNAIGQTIRTGTFRLYGYAGRPDGKIGQTENTREWLPQGGSRSLGYRFTEVIYRSEREAAADSGRLNSLLAAKLKVRQ